MYTFGTVTCMLFALVALSVSYRSELHATVPRVRPYKSVVFVEKLNLRRTEHRLDVLRHGAAVAAMVAVNAGVGQCE